MFGIPTLPKTMDKNLAIIQMTLDIFIGQMQLTIQDQYRRYTMDNTPYTSQSLLGEWHQKMITSMNLIILRMKRKPYKHHWLYSKPEILTLQNPDRHNWTSIMATLLNSSIKLDDPDSSTLQDLILTSDLQISETSDIDMN